MRAHDRARPERVREGRADVAAGHAEAEARLLLPQHRLAVEAERDDEHVLARVHERRASDRSSKSAGPVEPRHPEAAVEARRERQRDAARTRSSARARRARGRARRAPRARATRARRRARAARGSRAAGRRRASTAARSRVRCPATTSRDAERAHGGDGDREREHAGERLAPALPEREARERGQHRADVAELLGQVVAAEPAREVVQRRRPQRGHARRHEQVGEVELVAVAADPERIGVRRARPTGTATPTSSAIP